jgi:hypothetical protein
MKSWCGIRSTRAPANPRAGERRIAARRCSASPRRSKSPGSSSLPPNSRSSGLLKVIASDSSASATSPASVS